MPWPYHAYPRLLKVSMESMDTFLVGHQWMILECSWQLCMTEPPEVWLNFLPPKF